MEKLEKAPPRGVRSSRAFKRCAGAWFWWLWLDCGHAKMIHIGKRGAKKAKPPKKTTCVVCQMNGWR